MLMPIENWRNTSRHGLVFDPLMRDFQYQCELNLAITKAQLDLFPTLEFEDEAESEQFPWPGSVECVRLKPKTVEAWDRAWAVQRILKQWRHEGLEALRPFCRICLTIVGFLVRPVFPFRLISKERAWSLLHGAHPPRHNAGISTPAFRVS